MTVYAILPGSGEPRELAAHLGATIQDVYKSLRRGALTGSAAALDGVELDLADGTKVPFGSVVRFEEDRAFLG